MKELKHSKYKNTGILFELLARQITVDIIEGKNSKAATLLKKYFSKETELYKEYALYNTLLTEKYSSEHKSSVLIDTIINARKKLDKKQLQEEKFNLIREIKQHFDLNNFFKTALSDYKTYASIYKLFEYHEDDNPLDIVRSKNTLIDNILKTKQPLSDRSEFDVLHEQFKYEAEDVRLLSYKILVNKFNEKYGHLEENQKQTLREFILNISNSNNLKQYIVEQTIILEKYFNECMPKIEDKVLKIKLNELLKLTDSLKGIKFANDDHVIKLLKLQELKNEIGRII